EGNSTRYAFVRTHRALDDDSGRRPDHCPHLGVGDWRCGPFSKPQTGSELWRIVGAEDSSAGKTKRTPISKQRHKHVQTVLIEAAQLAPRLHADLALLHTKELEKGNHNRATLAVARKLVAYLLAVDRRKTGFHREGIAASQAA